MRSTQRPLMLSWCARSGFHACARRGRRHAPPAHNGRNRPAALRAWSHPPRSRRPAMRSRSSVPKQQARRLRAARTGVAAAQVRPTALERAGALCSACGRRDRAGGRGSRGRRGAARLALPAEARPAGARQALLRAVRRVLQPLQLRRRLLRRGRAPLRARSGGVRAPAAAGPPRAAAPGRPERGPAATVRPAAANMAHAA